MVAVSEHQVICRTCRGGNGRGPRRWLWLCPDCAQECAETHRREYPDHDLELRITQEPSMARLQRDIRTLRLVQKRGGW